MSTTTRTLPGTATECGCQPAHVLAPTNTASGVQRCDVCSPEGFGDLAAAAVLAEHVGGTVQFYAEVAEHVAGCYPCRNTDSGCDDGRTAVAWAGPGDDRIIASGTDPWVEIDGQPVEWAS